MTHAKRVYFVHTLDPRQPGDVVGVNVDSEDETPEHDEVLAAVKDLVDREFHGDPETQIRCAVLFGHRLRKMVEFAIDKDIDLILIGSQRAASRVFPEKMARNAPCSILIVPEDAPPECNRILVPTDFSKLSAEAMKVAISACKVIDGDSLTIHRVLRVPQGYHKTGKSYEEVADSLRERSEKDCGEFLKDFDLSGLPVNVECSVRPRVVASILESAKENDANLIVMGARGRTGPAAFLLGSVAEKIIRTVKVPLLAVKKKGANMTFLQALFEL
jgi:nucleotide-binding universal stress UspA family protein